MSYIPAVQSLRFCLDHVLETQDFEKTQGLDQDLRQAIFEAAGQISRDILSPLNPIGDKQMSRLIDQKVVLPEGFLAAINSFAEGGWNGLSAQDTYGGQGLPKMWEIACFDMFNAANMAFSLLPTLSQGAIEALSLHGTEAQKSLYLPRLIEGKWSGTMNLTEPQAGSDLSALTTKAIPKDGGGYLISGTKIYITWGEHEGGENILHLVLARLPDAPEGTKGISLFLCPKFLITPEGLISSKNSVTCIGLEHKIGIHASPTCVMSFDHAYGELIGAPNQGLKAMFTMMNAARLMVGVQGVGMCEIASQKATLYAKERRQGVPVLSGVKNGAIFDHPDVRLNLGLMRAKTEAVRGLCLLTAFMIDQAHSGESQKRELFQHKADFLVPIAKAYATDMGVDVASASIQIHGGMGYVEETGIGQIWRDSRIAPIYEGTNAIQAADLTLRKLGEDGKTAFELISELRDFLSQTDAFSQTALSGAITDLEEATLALISFKKAGNLAAALTVSCTYLSLWGKVIGAYLLFKGKKAARTLLQTDHDFDPDFLHDRIIIADLFATHILSHSLADLITIKAGPCAIDGLKLN